MKARIIYTKFYQDSYVRSLSPTERFLFLYLFTNSHVGLSDCYEIDPGIIQFETGLNMSQIETSLKKFEEDKKYVFYEGWLKIINCEKYNQFSGEKNEVAKNKELEMIPDRVSEYFDRVSIGYSCSSNTPSNHNHNLNHNLNKKYISDFEKFWNKYPRKIGKPKAKLIYEKLATSEDVEKDILCGLDGYIKKWESENTEMKYIPHPTTWLNQGRWTDELEGCKEDSGYKEVTLPNGDKVLTRNGVIVLNARKE